MWCVLQIRLMEDSEPADGESLSLASHAQYSSESPAGQRTPIYSQDNARSHRMAHSLDEGSNANAFFLTGNGGGKPHGMMSRHQVRTSHPHHRCAHVCVCTGHVSFTVDGVEGLDEQPLEPFNTNALTQSRPSSSRAHTPSLSRPTSAQYQVRQHAFSRFARACVCMCVCVWTVAHKHPFLGFVRLELRLCGRFTGLLYSWIYCICVCVLCAFNLKPRVHSSTANHTPHYHTLNCLAYGAP